MSRNDDCVTDFIYCVTYDCFWFQELHLAIKSRDILAVLQGFGEGVDLTSVLPGNVSIFTAFSGTGHGYLKIPVEVMYNVLTFSILF